MELSGHTIVVDGLQSSPRCRDILLLRFGILRTVFFSWSLLPRGRTAVSTVPSFSLSDSNCSFALAFRFSFLATVSSTPALSTSTSSVPCTVANSSSSARPASSRMGLPKAGLPDRGTESVCFGVDGQKSTLTPRWDSFRWLGCN
jgi:hypothetical protein